MDQVVDRAQPQINQIKEPRRLNIAFRCWPTPTPARAVAFSFRLQLAQRFLSMDCRAADSGRTCNLRNRPARQGPPDGERFYVDSFTDYVSDVATLVGQVKSHAPVFPSSCSATLPAVVACLHASSISRKWQD